MRHPLLRCSLRQFLSFSGPQPAPSTIQMPPFEAGTVFSVVFVDHLKERGTGWTSGWCCRTRWWSAPEEPCPYFPSLLIGKGIWACLSQKTWRTHTKLHEISFLWCSQFQKTSILKENGNAQNMVNHIWFLPIKFRNMETLLGSFKKYLWHFSKYSFHCSPRDFKKFDK